MVLDKCLNIFKTDKPIIACAICLSYYLSHGKFVSSMPLIIYISPYRPHKHDLKEVDHMAYLTYFDHTCMLMYLVSEKCPYAKTPKLSIFIINLLYIPIKVCMQLYKYIYIYHPECTDRVLAKNLPTLCLRSCSP